MKKYNRNHLINWHNKLVNDHPLFPLNTLLCEHYGYNSDYYMFINV